MAYEFADFRPTPEQMHGRMNWLAGFPAQHKIGTHGDSFLFFADYAKTLHSAQEQTDGPYAEVKEFVSGGVLLRVIDLGEAVSLARSIPVFLVGGTVEERAIYKRIASLAQV